MPLIMPIQGKGLMRPRQLEAFPSAPIRSPASVNGLLANFSRDAITFSIFKMHVKPASMGVSCNMRLCTTAQLVGGPFDGSTIDLMSTPNGVGIVIGGIFGRTG